MLITYKTLIFFLTIWRFANTQASKTHDKYTGHKYVQLAAARPIDDQNEFSILNLFHSKTWPYLASRRTKRQLPVSHPMFDRRVAEFQAAAQVPNQPYEYHRYMRPYDNRNFPFEEIIERKDIDRIGNPLYVTVYMKATIKKSHTGRTRPAIPKAIYDYLDLVGFIHGQGDRDPNADQAGHLLAFSLGGTNDDLFNFAPQTARLNTQTPSDYSMWWGEEVAMTNFLKGNPNRYITWELLVLHPPLTTTGPLRLRPNYFCLRHTNINENRQMVDNYNKQIQSREPVHCFCNDAQNECRYASS